ncbi:MAG: hypothetical protein MI724_21100 [Spirochaetales bacterium]|nr:hypothetical protein [Spirochaetales bacterium]
MILVTAHHLQSEIPDIRTIDRRELESASVSALPRRQSIAAPRHDVTVVVAPGCGGATMSRLHLFLEGMGYATTTLHVPRDGASPPATQAIDDARCILLPIEERSRVEGHWMWWVLGRASARTARQAVVPIPRRDHWKEPSTLRPRPAAPLTALPYIGMAKAIGEATESLWVMPPERDLDSREAVNFDWWLHERS